MSGRGLFITGTDTGVGKTLVTAAMLHVARGLGLAAVGMKPVAAGCEEVSGAWRNEDVDALIAAGIPAPVELVNPYRFRPAIAPHIAAEWKGERIEIARIRAAFDALFEHAERVLVEGAGGFRVPLDDRHDLADLAVALDLPVVLVVGMRLGCINHALLTAEAIAARGLRLAAWVANRIDPDMAAYAENLKTLQQRLDAPMLAELPRIDPADPAVAARFIVPRRLAQLLA